jgi:hypothetical protein
MRQALPHGSEGILGPSHKLLRAEYKVETNIPWISELQKSELLQQVVTYRLLVKFLCQTTEHIH